MTTNRWRTSGIELNVVLRANLIIENFKKNGSALISTSKITGRFSIIIKFSLICFLLVWSTKHPAKFLGLSQLLENWINTFLLLFDHNLLCMSYTCIFYKIRWEFLFKVDNFVAAALLQWKVVNVTPNAMCNYVTASHASVFKLKLPYRIEC